MDLVGRVNMAASSSDVYGAHYESHGKLAYYSVPKYKDFYIEY